MSAEVHRYTNDDIIIAEKSMKNLKYFTFVYWSKALSFLRPSDISFLHHRLDSHVQNSAA
jgi:hypothetical protein